MGSREETGEAGSTSLGLASLNNSSRFWGIVAVSNCVVPGPGVIRAGHSGSACANPIKEVVQAWLWVG